ncbi:MAG: response regulator [Candidatus Marinimicrobia bacterium]|nr:response regulator [Candidatus Neomarinimicrobiota bacterium]MCF7880563.1 response regulator [Candidatus Neomarinimicrobiota bacterium]
METKILVVNKDEATRKLFLGISEEFEVPIDVFANWYDGLTALLKKEYGLIFIDTNLGDLTGLEFLRLVNGLDLSAATVLLSASLEKELFHERSDIRADVYLERPISVIDVLNNIVTFTQSDRLQQLLKKKNIPRKR